MDEGVDSTRISMKKRQGKISYLSDAMRARLGPQAPSVEKKPCISKTMKTCLGPPTVVVMSK